MLDLTRVLAGPFCSMILGDMGAEVIKVEEPGKGDDTRSWPPFLGGEATYFMSVNRGKKSITVNLKAPEGRQLLERLARKSDVVLENFRTGTMERLGLGYKRLAKLNPKLVYCAISGFGESGPESHRAGYDLIVQAESGLMDITGFEDGAPVKVGTSIADLVAGMSAAHGITLALLARHRTEARPEGRDLDARRHGGAADLPGRHLLRHRPASRHGGATSIRRSCPTRSSRPPMPISRSAWPTTRCGSAAARRWRAPT